MAHPYKKAAHKNDPKWMSGVRKYATGGRVDDETPHSDKMLHGQYYGKTSGDAVKQVSHFARQGDYDPYEAMGGPEGPDFQPRPDPYSDKNLKRGGKVR